MYHVLDDQSRLLYDTSLTVVGNVLRIPLKGNATDEEEAKHLQASFDGLLLFHPVDIYEDNINSSEGLINVFNRLREMEGFGQPDSGAYSLLVVDVAIYWKILRILYAYSGMAPIRRDLFLCFGLWHCYHYAHVALWHEFRATFLAPAFFALFPGQKLLARPFSHGYDFLIHISKLLYSIS